jgi:integrase
LPANPWTATQAPGWERDRKRRVRRPSWTPEEFTRLHQAARPWLRDLLTLGTQTGLRISALVNLEWRDVEWTRDGPGFGTVRVRPELDKTARGYSVPMSRACHDLLAARFARKDADERYVLTSARGGKVRVSVVDRSIRAAARKAGLGEITSPAHMLRRSFGRWAIMGHLTGRPIPLYVVSTWFGHSDTRMTQYYLDITETESQNWMEESRSKQEP